MGVVTPAAPLRGEIWLVDLDPTVGSEIRKTRPAIVVSPDGMNRRSRLLTVVPMTSGSRPAPFRVAVHFKGIDGLVLAEQARTLDRIRFRKRLGTVDLQALNETLAILREMFAE